MTKSIQTRFYDAVLWMGLVAIFVGRATTPVYAEYDPRECRSVYGNPISPAEEHAADARLDACWRSFLGVIPIEERAAAGQSVVRALIIPGERALPVLIEYVRARDGRTWINIRILLEGRPKLEKAIAPSEFESVRYRWSQRAAWEKEETPILDAHQHTIETVCIPRGGATAEVVEGGRIERSDLDVCKGEYQFADFLFARALADFGDCPYSANADDEDYNRLRRCVITRSVSH